MVEVANSEITFLDAKRARRAALPPLEAGQYESRQKAVKLAESAGRMYREVVDKDIRLAALLATQIINYGLSENDIDSAIEAFQWYADKNVAVVRLHAYDCTSIAILPLVKSVE